MFNTKGESHMKRTALGVTGAVLTVGLIAGPSAQATIDKTDAAGNTIQVTHTKDVVKSQFSLWPLGDNVANIKTTGNVANNGGNNTTGIPWLLGNGAGNVVQVGSGGNVFAPQTALGVDNHTTITTWGNEAVNNGNGSHSLSGGKNVGTVVDGNGNVFQVMFFQGNVFAPQTAINGDNFAVINTGGNYAAGNGNGSSQVGNGGALALVDGNGNIVQFMILSNNVIAPQIAVNGSNDLVVNTAGNMAYDNGNGSTTVSHQQVPLSAFGLPGVFTITTYATGNGNVTQVAILSNNVIAPQIAIPGPRPGSGKNTSAIDTLTNDSDGNGNESETDTDGAQGQHQVGNGNTDQTAHDSGAIWNPQIGAKTNVAAPVVVNAPVAKDDPPPAVVQDDPPPADDDDSKPLVRESLNFSTNQPDVVVVDEDSSKVTPPKKPAWKPGDGIKKVVNAITSALPKPKPKPAASDAPAA